MKVILNLLLLCVCMALCSMQGCGDSGHPIFILCNDSDMEILVFAAKEPKEDVSELLRTENCIAYDAVKGGDHAYLFTNEGPKLFYKTHPIVNVYVLTSDAEGTHELLWHQAFTEAELKAMNFALHYPPTEN